MFEPSPNISCCSRNQYLHGNPLSTSIQKYFSDWWGEIGVWYEVKKKCKMFKEEVALHVKLLLLWFHNHISNECKEHYHQNGKKC